MSLLKRLEQKTKTLTASQQQLADYITRNMDNVVFFSINQLAQKTDVSEATVFRFAQALGYEGYQDFIKHLQQEVQDRISAGSLFDLERYDQNHNLGETLEISRFTHILQQEINNISALSNMNMKNVDLLVEKLSKSRNIIIIGLMASGSIAHYYASQLGRVFRHVRLITSADIFSASTIADITKDSVVIHLAFPRYPTHLEHFAKKAQEQKAFCVSVTSSHQSPTLPYTDCCFIVNHNPDRWFDSFATPMVLLHAIMAEFGKKYPQHIRKALKDYDEYVKEFGLFS